MEDYLRDYIYMQLGDGAPVRVRVDKPGCRPEDARYEVTAKMVAGYRQVESPDPDDPRLND